LIVTEVKVVTRKWVTANVIVLADPVRTTLTEAGTVTALTLLLVSFTITPEEVVGPSKVRVPVTVSDEPPTTDEGDTLTPARLDG